MPQAYEYPQEVLIVGDWTRWQRKEPMKRVNVSNGDRYYSILLALSEGLHQYKFIVDGAWRHDPSAPTIRNEFGELNNII
jgi:5'-AMP-activated protein kinase regulatory beta subunit